MKILTFISGQRKRVRDKVLREHRVFLQGYRKHPSYEGKSQTSGEYFTFLKNQKLML